MNSEQQIQLDIERCRRKGGLHRFVRLAWSLVEPSVPYCDNWHIKLICDHLEALYRGDIQDLLILQPPGTMKSLLTGVFFPAWEAAQNEGKSSWINASFDDGLTSRDSGKFKDLVSSPWYQARWPKTKVNKNQNKPQGVSNWYLTGGGEVFSTSVKGKGTGHHGDYLRVDDPTKPKDATTAEIEAVKAWWKDTFSSRQKSPTKTRRLVVQQRVAFDDLPGMLLDLGTWTVVCLPMEYDPDRHCKTPFGEDPRTEPGQLLWPERYGQKEVDKLKSPDGVGEMVFACQYNQLPSVKGGLIFKRDWMLQTVLSAPEGCYLIQSWDMRFKEASDSGDMVVGAVWGKLGTKYYRVTERRGPWSFVRTCKELVDLSEEFPDAFLKLIENKANGPAVVSALKKVVQGMVLVEPLGSKVARAYGVSPLFEAGQVYLVEADWNEPYRKELEQFPKVKRDDRVDETSQALARLRDHLDSVEDFEKAMENVANGNLPW